MKNIENSQEVHNEMVACEPLPLPLLFCFVVVFVGDFLFVSLGVFGVFWGVFLFLFSFFVVVELKEMRMRMGNMRNLERQKKVFCQVLILPEPLAFLSLPLIFRAHL